MPILLNNPLGIEQNAMDDYLNGDDNPLIELTKSGKQHSDKFNQFVADVIAGTIQKKRGPKKLKAVTLMDTAGPMMLKYLVENRTAELKSLNVFDSIYGKDFRQQAMDEIAKQFSIQTDMEKYINQRKAKKPKQK